MRISVTQERFESVIERAFTVVPSKTTMPILRTVYVECKNGELAVSATDLELMITIKTSADVAENGVSVIPAKRLYDLAKTLQKDVPVRLESEDESAVIITSGQGKFKISTEEPSYFPQLPMLPPEPILRLPHPRLKRIIEKTLFAVATDELRPVLSGVLFQMKNGMLRVVSTDGHKLVKWVDNQNKYEVPDFDWIIPKRALEVLSKMLDNNKDIPPVEIYLASQQLHFKLDQVTLSTRLIEGKFPLFDSVIPQNNPNILIAEVKPFLSAVKRVSVFSGALTKHIRIDLKSGEIVLSAEDTEGTGRGTEPLPVEYSGEQFTIGYNYSFLERILNQIDSTLVRFELSGPSGAGVIRPVEQVEGEDILMLLMPVRLN
ncbi:MAG: DNA polymerase III subunit beta [bacterium]|nr:DNA polymerase III subunit beta [bacterium]